MVQQAGLAHFEYLDSLIGRYFGILVVSCKFFNKKQRKNEFIGLSLINIDFLLVKVSLNFLHNFSGKKNVNIFLYVELKERVSKF